MRSFEASSAGLATRLSWEVRERRRRLVRVGTLFATVSTIGLSVLPATTYRAWHHGSTVITEVGPQFRRATTIEEREYGAPFTVAVQHIVDGDTSWRFEPDGFMKNTLVSIGGVLVMIVSWYRRRRSS